MTGGKRPGWMNLMSIDPGGTTGAAYADVPSRARDVATAFKKGEWETAEFTGPSYEQAATIADEWEFRLRPVLIIESFQLRPSKARGAGSDPKMLDPVRVTEGILAVLWSRKVNVEDLFDEERIVFQTPQEKASVTSDRLRRFGLWIPKSDHKRDAMRHLVVRVSKELR